MKRKFRLLTLAAFSFLVFILTGNNLYSQHQHGHPPGSVNGYINMLETPDRASWQMPEKVANYLGIKEGDVIADIGAGSGYFTVFLSKKAGNNGKVLACDIEKGMINYIKERIKKENLKNVVPVLCKPDDPMLSPSSADLVFICDTYHHIEKRNEYLKLLKKYSKPEGRIAIIDYQKKETPHGPPLSMRISKEDIVKEITDAGYKLEAEFFFLPYQYFMIFIKN